MRRHVTYLIYRHGANRSNQSLGEMAPVAIVTARSRTAATATERHDPPGKLDLYACATMVLAPWVTVWANQRLSAVPLSRASRKDIRAVREVAYYED